MDFAPTFCYTLWPRNFRTLGLPKLSTENYETKIARLLLFSDWAEFYQNNLLKRGTPKITKTKTSRVKSFKKFPGSLLKVRFTIGNWPFVSKTNKGFYYCFELCTHHNHTWGIGVWIDSSSDLEKWWVLF